MSEPSAIETSSESAALAGGWLVNIDGDEIVEMTRVQIVASFGSGRIQENTLVWHEGMDDWAPLVQVPAFRLLSLRESSVPESGARVKTRSKPPPKPIRNRVTETGLGPPDGLVAGSRPYVDAEGTSDSVTQSRDSLGLLSRDVIAIAEREALEVQQTSDSVTVARALLEPNLDAPSDPGATDETSVLAVYDRPVATIEFPTGDESTAGAKLDDDPTQMRAPIAPSALPPAPARKPTPIAFPPPAPPNPADAKARAPLPAPITTSTPRSTMPALRQPAAAPYVAGPIRPAAGTPAIRPSTLAPAPERRPPLRNPPPDPLDARGQSAAGATLAPGAAPASVPPAPPPLPVTLAPAPVSAAAPAAALGPTPLAFAARAAAALTATGAPITGVPGTRATSAGVAPRVVMPSAVTPPPPAATAPLTPAFRASSLPSLSELDAAALRGGRRVPLFWAVGGCLASAALASFITAMLTSRPAPVAAVTPPAVEAPKVMPPLPSPAPPPAPVATVEPAASADLAKAIAAPPELEKPKKARVAWKPRPKAKPAEPTESATEAPSTQATSASSPDAQGDASGLEKPAAAETNQATSAPQAPPTWNPGF